MFETSSNFKNLVRQSHKALTKAEVWQGDNLVLQLDPIAGSVEDDSRRTVRRTCQVNLFSPAPETSTENLYNTYTDLGAEYATYTDLASSLPFYAQTKIVVDTTPTTIDNGIVPSTAFDPLSPFGNELRLWRGIETTRTLESSYASINTTIPTTYRTNLITNPSFEDNTTGWSARGTSVTISRSNAQIATLTRSCAVVNSATPASDDGLQTDPDITVSPNTSYTFSAYVRVTTATSNAGYVSIIWRDSGGSVISTTTGTSTTIPASWIRLSASATSPSNAASATLVVSYPIASATFYVDACLFETGTLEPYFEPGVHPQAEWTGTANASTSTLRINWRANFVQNPSAETNTTGWSTNSVSISRITTDAKFGSACVRVSGGTAANHGVQIRAVSSPTSVPAIPWVPGQNGIFQAWVKVPTGSPAVTLRVRRNQWTGPTGSLTADAVSGNTTIDDSMGWVLLHYIFGTTNTINQIGFRIEYGATPPASPVFLVDGVIVEQRENQFGGGYFDGYNGSASWIGTPHASASISYTSRNNLIFNSGFERTELSPTYWVTNVANHSIITTDSYEGSACLQVENTSTATTTLSQANSTWYRPFIKAGTTITFSAYRKNTVGTRTHQLRLFGYSTATGGTNVSGQDFTSSVFQPSSTWARSSMTATITADCFLESFITTGSGSVGDRLLVDNMLLEISPTVNDYYDSLETGAAPAVGTYFQLGKDFDTYGQLGQDANQTSTYEELVPLGVFVMTNVDMEQANGGVNIQVTGQDRSLRISRNRWIRPYKITSGTNVATAIQNLLEDRWDDVECAFAATEETTNQIVLGTEPDNDPWKDAQKIAKSAGLELYFDGNGIARLEPVPSYEDKTPDEIYRENDEAMVLAVRRSLSTEQTYSGVIATGESSQNTTVYRSVVWDDDPESPTYRYGPFGEVPRFYNSPFIKTQATADKVAAAILSKSKGAQEAISWTQITDPSLESGDSIGLINTATKVNRVLVIDRLSIPLRATEPMSCTARTVKQSVDEEQAVNRAVS